MHFHRWIRYFTARGHEIHFVSYQPVEASQIEAIEQAGGRFHGELGPFHLKRFWRTGRSVTWLRSLLRKTGMDVVHCHFLGANAWYAALSGFRPYILTIMGGGDVTGPDWRPQGLRAGLLTPLALRRAVQVTSWSHQMAKVVQPYCQARMPVAVLHGGVDLTCFHPGEKPDSLRERWGIPAQAKVVFSPRLMRPLSNIETIARASQLVAAAEPDAYFLYAAPGALKDSAYERQVRAAAEAGEAGARTRFVGTIAHGEIADYYRLADVTVSIPDTDGTPMSALESMACGTPVLAGDIPDYDPEYFDPGVTMLSANRKDPALVARAILTLLWRDENVQAMITEAHRRVLAHGSYESQMARVEAMYQQVGLHG
jgi:glycosyltransferase involved in cell wall biosynthesis